ncbi:MAG: peptidoglycan-associated lipoprotein Pal [Syntrophaceae bacterium]|nr:peptidoglycan-associated lipoprotein Pal [Syntrophaceae bacterium]
MKSRFVRTMVILACLVLLFTVGCAKKAVKEDTGMQEQKVTAQATKADDDAARKAAEAAARERALREEEARRAEQERLAREKAEKLAALFADVNFDFDKYNIKPDFRDRLNEQAAWLKSNAADMLLVEGHCDERGTAEYNLALGERRANAVMKYLIDLGIDKGRIKTISYGKERPLDPAQTEEAWAKNRRAHFEINPK